MEENNRRVKTRDLFKKSRNTEGTFHTTMGTIKDRNDEEMEDLKEIEELKWWQEYTEKLYKKKILMIWITMMVVSLTQSQTFWNVMSSGP